MFPKSYKTKNFYYIIAQEHDNPIRQDNILTLPLNLSYPNAKGYIKKDVLIKDILFYLNNNYREKITLEQLSKKFRASVSYICHEFTKEYRISPINYVIQRRMTEAKWSLTNTELSQAEISWRVGYENVDHFAKLFLRHVGCSPSDYRRQFKNCFAEQEILSEFPQPVSLAG